MATHFKRILTAAALLCSFGLNAAIVTGNFQNNLGSNYNGTFVVTNTVNAQTIGTNIIVGKSTTIQLVNGAFTNNLVAGNYVGNAAGYTIKFPVPNDSSATVYRLEQLATNLTTFTYTNIGVFAIAPGTNTTATTNNGLVTISAAGGSLVNATNNDTVVSNGVVSASVLKANNGTDFTDLNLTRSNIGVGNLSRISASFGTNSYGGDMSNATPTAPYQLAITEQGNGTALWVSGSTTKGDYKHSLDIPAGIQSIGNPNGLMDPNAGNITIYMGYGPSFKSGSSDTVLHLRSGATSPNNSGTGVNLDIGYLDATGTNYQILDPVGCSFMYVPTNKITSLIPGYAMFVFNRNANMKGLAVCGPSFSDFDSGNYSMQYWDFLTQEVGIPYYQAGLYNPTNTGFLKAFAISPKTALASFYSNVTVGGSSYIARGLTNGANLVVTNNAYIEGVIRAGNGASGGGGQVITMANGNLNGAVLDPATTINVSNAQIAATNFFANTDGSGTVAYRLLGGTSGMGSRGGDLTLLVSGTEQILLDPSFLRLVGSKSLYWGTDGGGDIGAAAGASGRPGNIYARYGISTGIATKTTSYTLTTSDSTILLNGTTLTATLPTAVGNIGRMFTVKLIANSTATVGGGGVNIDGSANYTLSAQYKYVTVQSDGTQWWVIANN